METLVLDQSWRPTSIVPWQRAMVLLAEGKVEVVDEYEDRFVRTVTLEFKMPAVIRFLKGIRGSKRAVRFSRENIFLRDKSSCQYCGEKVHRHDSTYDHVTPRSQGGKTVWENILLCCLPCNQRKGGRTPQQANMKPLSWPVKPKKLPNVFFLTFSAKKNMPDQWSQWLQSVAYWHAELEE